MKGLDALRGRGFSLQSADSERRPRPATGKTSASILSPGVQVLDVEGHDVAPRDPTLRPIALDQDSVHSGRHAIRLRAGLEPPHGD